jgi:type I restriction enzyme, S subunit
MLTEADTCRKYVLPKLYAVLEIPLPPLAEQRRIVARIEQLAAKIEEARILRQQAAEAIEALRFTVLRSVMLSCNAKDGSWRSWTQCR